MAQLTDTETSEILRLKPSTLAVWRRRGEGPPYARYGNRVWYSSDDIDTWLAEQKSQSTAEEDLHQSADYERNVGPMLAAKRAHR